MVRCLQRALIFPQCSVLSALDEPLGVGVLSRTASWTLPAPGLLSSPHIIQTMAPNSIFLLPSPLQTTSEYNECFFFFLRRKSKLFSISLKDFHYSFFFIFNVSLFLRERVWVGQGTERERERERKTQNPKQAPGSELSAWSPMRGSNSWNVRSWCAPKSDA